MKQAKFVKHAHATGVVLRRPQLADGAVVHDLVRRCPPLDLNSTYSYFLLCSHHAETCVVAQQGGEIVGFLSAYRLPQAPQTLFVWQLAVAPTMRGRGLAGQMLDEVYARQSRVGVEFIETTVSPTNHASRQVFARFANQRQLPVQECMFLCADHFGGELHDDETLIRIGPIASGPDA